MRIYMRPMTRSRATAVAAPGSGRLALAALLAGAMIIALAPILVRLSDVGSTATGFYRLLLAIPLYCAIAMPAAGARPAAAAPATTRDRAMMCLAGVFLACDLVVWHLSIRMTTVANATLLANVAPVFVVLTGWMIFRIRVTRTYLSGLAAALAGTLVLTGASLSIGWTQFSGDLLGVLTAVFYAAYQMTVGRLRWRFPTVVIMIHAVPAGAVFMLPIALLSGEQLVPAAAAGWLVLAALAAGPQVVGQGLIAWAMAHLPVAFASVSLLVQPVAAAALAWMLFGEHMTVLQGLAAAVVLAGIAIARRGSVR